MSYSYVTIMPHAYQHNFITLKLLVNDFSDNEVPSGRERSLISKIHIILAAFYILCDEEFEIHACKQRLVKGER